MKTLQIYIILSNIFSGDHFWLNKDVKKTQEIVTASQPKKKFVIFCPKLCALLDLF